MSFEAHEVSLLEMPSVHTAQLKDSKWHCCTHGQSTSIKITIFENGFNLSESEITVQHQTTEKNVGRGAFEAQQSASSWYLKMKYVVWSRPGAEILPEPSLRAALSQRAKGPKGANWTGTSFSKHQLRCSFPLAMPPQLNPPRLRTRLSPPSQI